MIGTSEVGMEGKAILIPKSCFLPPPFFPFALGLNPLGKHCATELYPQPTLRLTSQMGKVERYYILWVDWVWFELGATDALDGQKHLDFVLTTIIDLKMAYDDKLLWWLDYIYQFHQFI